MATQRTTAPVSTPGFGAFLRPDGGTSFRLWAPGAQQVALRLHQQSRPNHHEVAMSSRADGWFVCHHSQAGRGDLYHFIIDNHLAVPDPASRYQADGIHGPSLICDPQAFRWHDQAWQGRPWHEAVIYELHVGTFAPPGTFTAVTERLDHLVDLGVTAIELMPICQFPGAYNWGYDGALLFAPCDRYGRPDDLKALVDAAHQRGLMVFLDVVYNHFGPEGNYLFVYARDAFFSERFHTPWGAAINFSGPQSRTVRDFYIANALYWLEEFHFDGLRFDAVHAIFDDSHPDILEEISNAVHQGPGTKRHIHLILENDANQAHYLTRNTENSPRFFAAQWNDDYHHACHTLLTGETEGYYRDYSDNPLHHLGRCLSQGFAYQGEISPYRNGQRRGQPSRHLTPTAFVNFLQNHDQIGNRALGERLVALCPEEDLLLFVALTLLAPSIPLLFMGEEFGSDTPFLFFCNFGPDLASQVTEGRRREFASFAQFSSPEQRRQIPDPNDQATYARSCLQWPKAASDRAGTWLEYYRHLLQLRQRCIVPLLPQIIPGRAGFQLSGPQTLKVWWPLADGRRLSTLLHLDNQTLDLKLPVAAEIVYQQTTASAPTSPQNGLPPHCIIWFLIPDSEEAS